MPERRTKKTERDFAFRFKMGDYEVEINGGFEDVQNTIKDLPELAEEIDKAFQKIKPKKVATLTVKTEAGHQQKFLSQQYPHISTSERLDEAILKILETDWGKWRPRTIEELSEALKANRKEHSARALIGTLMDLVKKERIRRWNTNAGYVYIMAEKETFRSEERLNE